MKTEIKSSFYAILAARGRLGSFPRLCLILLLGSLAIRSGSAATATIFSDDFEAYTGAATSLADTADADPANPILIVADDNPYTGTAGSGVQLVDWLAHSGSKALLLRSATEAQVQLPGARSGSRYTLDFWLHVVKGTGDRNFYIILRGMGADNNGDDFLAYQSDRAATRNIRYYDGVGGMAWVQTEAQHTESTWQHHRLVIDMATQTFTLYLDNMETPVLANADLSRPDVAVPTLLRIVHEGNSADDGYFAIDDVSLTVEGARDLATTFTEDFESYTAMANGLDDADPQGPWITIETDGAGSGKSLAPTKVQLVDSNVVMPHSGTNCVKIEGAQRAGINLAWGVPPQADVQITWWARVPMSVAGTEANYLRVSLYGVEGTTSYAGDSALLGYGSRSATVGDATSLTYYLGGAWVDTTFDYTPNTWEEYRLITHNNVGQYTIIKNPSSDSPVIVVDRAAFIGSASRWGPSFLVAWSSSNGTGHPPVYVDDIEILSLVSNPDPLPEPYTVTFHADRFTNACIVKVAGPVGGVAVDPRDNTSILFALDVAPPVGGIYRARKFADGNWQVELPAIVAGLDRPSGLAIAEDGTIWWTHDYTMSLMRLRAPWDVNVPEQVIANFGTATTDDDPIDVTIAPATFQGVLASGNMVIVADRGSDGDANNAVYFVDPTTTELDQAMYDHFLVPPSATALGTNNLNAIAPLPQTGEVVTLSQDGCITAIDGSGIVRPIIPDTLYLDPLLGMLPSAVAVDPTTGRIWIADDILDQVWSVGYEVDPFDRQPDRQEFSFPLTNPSRPDRQLDVHDPGMAFAPDGSILVLSDTSTADGTGRLLVFHNETFTIPEFKSTAAGRDETGVHLRWEPAGNVTFRVQRRSGLTPESPFEDISGDLKGTQFTDTNAPPGQAFYRILAKP